MVASDESIDTGGIKFRDLRPPAGVIEAVTENVKGNKFQGAPSKDVQDTDAQIQITDVEESGCETEEIGKDEETKQGPAVEVVNGKKEFGSAGSEVKDGVDVGFGNGNTGNQSDKAGDGMSASGLPTILSRAVARLPLLSGLKRRVPDWIRGLPTILSRVVDRLSLLSGLKRLVPDRIKSPGGFLFCLVLATYGVEFCAANDLNHCGDTLPVKILKYGETYSFICPTSRQNKLKLYADGHVAYNGYERGDNYSMLQVKLFEIGYNFTITAGKDTPRCFKCLDSGTLVESYFLIHSEPKDVENVKTGFTNPDVKTVSTGFANFANSGMKNSSGGFNIVVLMVVVVTVLALQFLFS